MDEYTDFDKAQWILENGNPKITWIYERANDVVYRRPITDPSVPFPPWINKERTPIQTLNTGAQHGI